MKVAQNVVSQGVGEGKSRKDSRKNGNQNWQKQTDKAVITSAKQAILLCPHQMELT
jgi:hypothetical protein